MLNRKVDFIIVGVQKAGTTALHTYLSDIPEIGLAKTKEPHFFDDEAQVDWEAPNYDSYHALFPNKAPLWGEATPIYLYWPPAIPRIYTYRADMKIIILLRDPVERAFSQWQMEFARGFETQPFSWCIRAGRARVVEGQPEMPGYHRVYSYVERGFYGAQLARVLSVFPSNQLHLAWATDLKRDPTRVVAGVCEFLGVAPRSGAILPQLVHAAASIDYPSLLTKDDVDLLRATFADDQRLLAKILSDLSLAVR